MMELLETILDFQDGYLFVETCPSAWNCRLPDVLWVSRLNSTRKLLLTYPAKSAPWWMQMAVGMSYYSVFLDW